MKRILIIGASGMLGSTLMRFFSKEFSFETYGTVRLMGSSDSYPLDVLPNLITGIDVLSMDSLHKVFADVNPDIVINCVGVVKQLSGASDPLVALPLNSLFPHRLAKLCSVSNSRLIHISTDCVFSGSKGMYVESDIPDADDLYGVSKRLGEVDYSNAITLRTSIIGHELNGSRSLIDWFLSQTNSVQGFNRAVFSGLPTIEIAHIINDYVIPNSQLRGLYHVSAEPINKYDLLSLVADIYEKDISIVENAKLIINRSLDSSQFRKATGFSPSSWRHLIQAMHDFK